MSTSHAPAGPAAEQRNQYGATALVLGILGIVTSFAAFFVIFAPLPLAVGLLAVTFGVLGRNRVLRGEAGNGGQATAGIVLGAVTVVLTVLFALGSALLVSFSSSGPSSSSVEVVPEFAEPAGQEPAAPEGR